jgi:YidC/Oxa1 family membrane protein insertase
MERRVLFAIVASFLVIYIWQALFIRPPAPSTTPSAPSSSTPATGAQQQGALPAEAPSAAPPAPTPSAAPVVAATEEQEIRVDTQRITAIFTNRGARLKSWRLKLYKDQSGAPLELVEQNLAATQPLPFSIRVADETMTHTLNSALYKVSGAPAPGTAATAPVNLRFEYQDSSGLHIVKTFAIEPASYVVAFKPTLTVGGQETVPQVQWGPGLGDREIGSSASALAGGVISIDGSEERLGQSQVAEQPTREGGFEFAGIDSHYFTSVAIAPGQLKVTFQPVTIPPRPGTTELERHLMAYTLEPPRPPPDSIRFYVGPKQFDELASVNRDLVRIINFGVFSFIVVPLLRSLTWINQYVNNYGWSIIVLTVIINLLILPLRHKAVVSMRKMQEIQPEAKAIQDRYAKLKATDPAKQKMNQELMALYRDRGVNPASGCVPMLIPFPVLIAFYSLLTTAIELRGAPFMLWIQDLSAPDPFYVTPILMGASQLWQTWIQPAAGDPAQRKMMLVMPVVFTFLFLGYPAGVALYWFASNIWGIGQQYFTNYLIGPPNVRTVRPAAERLVKRAAPGKTDAPSREE